VLHGGDHGSDDQGGHAGPAAAWAASAAPGERLGMIGPTVSHLRTPGEHAWKLIVGDETALPAIGALLESLGTHERALVFVEVQRRRRPQSTRSPKGRGTQPGSRMREPSPQVTAP
jgi:NADPH-dependent ferric siderophore reductase